VLDQHVVGLLYPQAEQVVGQVAAAHDGAVRARVEVDAGVLVFQAVARVAHDQALDEHVRRRHAYGVALVAAADGGAIEAAQRERLVDQQVGAVLAARHLDHIASLGLGDGLGQIVAGAHRDGGCLAGPGDGQRQGRS
jgi:hypothetical protein